MVSTQSDCVATITLVTTDYNNDSDDDDDDDDDDDNNSNNKLHSKENIATLPNHCNILK